MVTIADFAGICVAFAAIAIRAIDHQGSLKDDLALILLSQPDEADRHPRKKATNGRRLGTTMNIGWHPDEDATPTPHEVENMAAVLEGRHGRYAAEVADFLSTYHGQGGDAGRSWAWAGVAELVRKRERQRINQVWNG